MAPVFQLQQCTELTRANLSASHGDASGYVECRIKQRHDSRGPASGERGTVEAHSIPGQHESRYQANDESEHEPHTSTGRHVQRGRTKRANDTADDISYKIPDRSPVQKFPRREPTV